MPTRWNSDFACLSAHVVFEVPVRQLTSDPANNLKDYELTADQWTLAKELVNSDVLQVCAGYFALLGLTNGRTDI